MKRPRIFSWVVAVVLLSSVLIPGNAFATGSSLSIREIKITDDEFVIIQNTGNNDIDHLSDYWLGYVGSDTSMAPPVQDLPDYRLPSGGVVLLSGGGTVNTCDADIVSDLSPSLSDSKGTLNLWEQTSSGFSLLSGNQAQVRWNKSTSSDVNLSEETSQYANPVWFYDTSSGWLLTDMSGCTLTTYNGSTSTTAAVWPENDSSPPAIIESVAEGQGLVGLPAADIGLKAPQISELLPNPSGSGTDDTDEFIELYNPNDTAFDLSGFALETGLTTKHKYSFEDSTLLPAKSFTAFYSADTGLTLSNTSSQAILLDPLGTTISQSDAYSSAKDGMSWALANGKWYWTNAPTPGATNVVNQASPDSSKANKSSAPTVKGLSTGSSNSAPNSFSNTTIVSTPIHAWTLAGVGAAALLYAGYEYRNDLANNLYRVRRYIAARRAARK
ncbi:MAG TPA: lamin tail domain-containing protein [Candidatus Saccharimonadales bacterium]|nr:lamin tail domain-containing protein [Candidatus Saccharimonadales bacterium]